MIDPAPRSSMPGTTYLLNRKTERRLTAMVRSHSSSETSCTSPASK